MKGMKRSMAKPLRDVDITTPEGAAEVIELLLAKQIALEAIVAGLLAREAAAGAEARKAVEEMLREFIAPASKSLGIGGFVVKWLLEGLGQSPAEYFAASLGRTIEK
jgi:hypothetical protein